MDNVEIKIENLELILNSSIEKLDLLHVKYEVLKSKNTEVNEQFYNTLEKALAGIENRFSEIRRNIEYITLNEKKIRLDHIVNTIESKMRSIIQNFDYIEKEFDGLDRMLPISQVNADVFIIGKNGSGKSRYLKYINENVSSDSYIYIPAFREYNKIGKARPQKPKSIKEVFKLYDIGMTQTNTIEKILDAIKEFHFTSDERKTMEESFILLQTMWGHVLNDESCLQINRDSIGMKKFDELIDSSSFSDGEFNILIILLICIFMPEKSYIAIDEIELHINMYQLKRLISIIKQRRPDIQLLITTHNYYLLTEFKDNAVYYMNNGNLEKIESVATLSENIEFMNEFGNPRNVIFCEGTISTDERLYTQIFPDYNVKGAGNCKMVREITTVLGKVENSSNIWGIIDKDNLTEKERDKLLKQNIVTLPYRHKENFLSCEFMVSLYKKYSKSTYDNNILEKNFNALKQEIESGKKIVNYSQLYKNIALEKTERAINSGKTIEEIKNNISNLIETDFLIELQNPNTYEDYLHLSPNKNTCNEILKDFEERFITLLIENPDMAKEIRSEYFSFIPRVE